MSKKKRADTDKDELQTPEALALQPALPPPDNPQMRHECCETEQADEKQAAQKRLEAIQRIRETPPSEEDG